jgi:hypothetical protein
MNPVLDSFREVLHDAHVFAWLKHLDQKIEGEARIEREAIQAEGLSDTSNTPTSAEASTEYWAEPGWVRLTIFPNVWARELKTWSPSWLELVERVKHPKLYPTKASMPLVMLAQLGQARTDADSLRHEANVIGISGVALDYDAGELDIADAATLLSDASITGLFYTSPSSTPRRPRWRLLLPTSRELEPQRHRELVARANAILGGVLAPESFRLAQSYYIGRAEDAAHYEAQEVRGHRYIDQANGVTPLYPAAGNGEAPSAAAQALDDPVLVALRESGILQRAVKPGTYAICCPWEAEHTGTTTDSATVYMQANFEGRAVAGFDCKHAHCQHRTLRDLLGRLELLAKNTDAGSTHRSGKASSSGASEPSFDSNDSTSEWPEPKPILAELRAVPVFDADVLLPPELRAWIMDEAERMPCPPDFIAVAAVAALGSIIGAQCAIKPKARDSWLVVPNLWGGIVGDPSAKKTPAWSAALKPLDRLIAEALKVHETALAEYETAKVVFDAQNDAIESRIKGAANGTKGNKGDPADIAEIAKELRSHGDQAPRPPTLRRYKTNDTTVEKLGELLRENPQGVLVLRDELVGLVATWERGGREGERAFFLEAWNGNQSFDTDRIGRGHISIPNVCVSIFGGIQPDKLVVYLEQASNALANDGMLQRFQLLVYPNPRRWEWRDQLPDKDARDAAFAVFEKLADFDPVALGASPANDFTKFPHFNFDAEGQKVFVEWSEDMHLNRIPNEGDPIVHQHLAKFDKLFPALALIFHLVDCIANGVCGPVTKEAALRAAAWCEYLESHARRCYGLLKDDGLRAAQALAAKLERGELEDGFTLRDVRRNQWRSLTTDDAIQAAFDWLEDEDWLRAESTGGTGPGSGRRTTRYRINPAIGTQRKGGGG